jgi:two-component system KDP operon response regulator KdpE
MRSATNKSSRRPTHRIERNRRVGRDLFEDKRGIARGPRVVVVDNDIAVRRYLSWNLRAEGYHARGFASLEEAFDSILAGSVELLILDLDAPEHPGAAMIRSLQEVSQVPIIALSLAGDEKSMIEALRSGADDYVAKPFSLVELLARVQSVSRRRAREQGKPPLFLSGDMEIDLVRRRVCLQGREVHFSAKPYEVLRVLAENAGKVVSHRDILKAVWGSEDLGSMPYLPIAIRDLRQKLETDPACPVHITTEVRVGYRLRKASRKISIQPGSQ